MSVTRCVQIERVRLLGKLEGFHLGLVGIKLLVLPAVVQLARLGLGLLVLFSYYILLIVNHDLGVALHEPFGLLV